MPDADCHLLGLHTHDDNERWLDAVDERERGIDGSHRVRWSDVAGADVEDSHYRVPGKDGKAPEVTVVGDDDAAGYCGGGENLDIVPPQQAGLARRDDIDLSVA